MRVGNLWTFGREVGAGTYYCVWWKGDLEGGYVHHLDIHSQSRCDQFSLIGTTEGGKKP